jgi:hypothetical protein
MQESTGSAWTSSSMQGSSQDPEAINAWGQYWADSPRGEVG